MDGACLVGEPNKVAEIYRNYCPVALPVEVDKHLEFIEISEDGYTILGSSDLCGRYQKGSVWCFKNPSLAPNKDLCDTGLECESSVCDGKFLGSNKKIIVGQDSGALTIFEVKEEDDQPSKYEYKCSRHDHNNCVLSIDVATDTRRLLSAGMDMCIKVWDVEDFAPVHVYNEAHGHHVTNVTFADEQVTVFASCSLDGAALLWDTRQQTPATVLLDSGEEGLTALAWLSGDVLAVGSNFGNILTVDIRTKQIIRHSDLFTRPLYKLLALEQRLIAACADSHEVKVVEDISDDLLIRYDDKKHTDFVRGLAYNKKNHKLYSCGWDGQVICHTLET